MNKPTVLIAEDNVLIVEGCLLPALEPEFEVVATVEDGRAAVAAAQEYSPDVVLLDVSLPVIRGFEACRRILARQPKVKVLFVSNYSENSYADEALHMGASGYVLKSQVASELIPAIRTALSGQFYRSSSLH